MFFKTIHLENLIKKYIFANHHFFILDCTPDLRLCHIWFQKDRQSRSQRRFCLIGMSRNSICIRRKLLRDFLNPGSLPLKIKAPISRDRYSVHSVSILDELNKIFQIRVSLITFCNIILCFHIFTLNMILIIDLLILEHLFEYGN